MCQLNPATLRAWRLSSGMRPEEVCYRAGISFPYLRQLEDGTARNPSTDVLTRLAAVYGRPVGDLFAGHNRPVAS